VQVAGFANIVDQDVRWLQAAGFVNIVGGRTQGIQAAGFVNVSAGDVNAIQAAGFTNITSGKVNGFQAAGFININDGSVRGGQAGGFINLAQDVRGGQVAGFMNVADGDVRGAQVAGFMNVARRVWGAQIGVVNVCDSITGVPIGLLSIVRHGYHRLELWGGETLHGNIAFKTGVPHFYNIFAFGTQAYVDGTEDPAWGFGYGVGSELPIAGRFVMNLDVISYHLNEGSEWVTRLNSLTQLRIITGVRLGNGEPARRTALYFGPTFNVYVSQVEDPDRADTYGTGLAPYSHHTRRFRSGTLRMWTGFNVGVRI
ncbi:MAG: hypothetical protein WBA12_04630, partial [Catalinimonas sp.]